MPRYSVHGLAIDADFEIPELSVVSAPVVLDERPVRIAFASVPKSIAHTAVSKDGYLIGKDEILIVLEDGTRCHIQNAETVTIEVGRKGNHPQARFFALSAGIGCILHQRGFIPLHCTAVDTPQGCVAFCGNAGDGKSTLAASFAARGLQLFTDDRLTLHRTVAHQFLAVPSTPTLHLYSEASILSGLGDDNLAMDSYRFGKHVHLVPDSYTTTPKPMAGLYFTDWLTDETSDPKIITMTPIEAMMRLRRDVSLSHLVQLLDQERDFMEWAAKLCATVPAFHLLRPRNKKRHHECMDLIISHLHATFTP